MEEYERERARADRKVRRREKKTHPTMKVSGRGMKRFAGKKAPKR